MTKRFAPLDGIRGIATLYIFFFHAFSGHRLVDLFSYNFLAVRVFFAVSGYLMISSMIASETESTKSFYLRRIFRIVPLWWLIVMGMFVFQEISTKTFVFNMTFLFGFLSFDKSFVPIPQSWSLFVEVVFYLLFPVYFRFRNRLSPLAMVIVTLILANVWKYAAPYLGIPQTEYFVVHFPINNFHYFFLGILVFEWIHSPLMMGKTQKIPWDLLLAGLAVLIYFLEPLFGMIFVFALFLGGLRDGTLINRILSLKIFQWIGARCYFLYITHTFFLAWLLIPRGDRLALHLVGESLLILGLNLIVAAISYRYFETPLIRWGHKLSKRVGAQG